MWNFQAGKDMAYIQRLTNNSIKVNYEAETHRSLRGPDGEGGFILAGRFQLDVLTAQKD